jgi:hypothetical protein
MQIIFLCLALGAIYGIGYVLLRIYAELIYANELKEAEMKAAGIEIPER